MARQRTLVEWYQINDDIQELNELIPRISGSVEDPNDYNPELQELSENLQNLQEEYDRRTGWMWEYNNK